MKYTKIKKTIKILIIMMLAILLIGTISKVEATQTGNGEIKGLDDVQEQAQSFLEKGNQGAQISVKDAIDSFIPVGRVLVGIASIILVSVGAIFGVKYMLAGANDKAQMKEKLIYYVIAVVLVYGAVGIFSVVVTVMNNILS